MQKQNSEREGGPTSVHSPLPHDNHFVIVIGEDEHDLKSFSRGWEKVNTERPSEAVIECVSLLERKTVELNEMRLESYQASVVLLKRCMLENKSFVAFLRAATLQVEARADFRFLICFQDLTVDDLWEVIKEPRTPARDTIAVLAESVQVSGIQNVDEICGLLAAYVNEIENEERKRTVDLEHSRHVERLAFWLGHLRFAVPVTLFIWVQFLSYSGQIPQESGLAGWREIINALAGIPGIAFMFGLFSAPISVPIIYMLQSPNADKSKIRGFHMHLMMAVAVTVFVSFLVSHPDFSRAWWGLGFLLGGSLEGAYRKLFRVRAWLYAMQTSDIRTSFDEELVATEVGGEIDRHVYEAATGTTDNYARCDLLTSVNKHGSVFISYSRRSPWSTQRAEKMASDLREASVTCFLDRDCIPEGSSWRHHLYRYIQHNTLFITVLDDITAKSRWAAAELELALRSVYYIASPQIFVVAEEGYWQETDKSTTMPVFGTVGAPLQRSAYWHLRAPAGYVFNVETWPEVLEKLKAIAWLRIGLVGPRLSQVFLRARFEASKGFEAALLPSVALLPLAVILREPLRNACAWLQAQSMPPGVVLFPLALYAGYYLGKSLRLLKTSDLPVVDRMCILAPTVGVLLAGWFLSSAITPLSLAYAALLAFFGGRLEWEFCDPSEGKVVF